MKRVVLRFPCLMVYGHQRFPSSGQHSAPITPVLDDSFLTLELEEEEDTYIYMPLTKPVVDYIDTAPKEKSVEHIELLGGRACWRGGTQKLYKSLKKDIGRLIPLSSKKYPKTSQLPFLRD